MELYKVQIVAFAALLFCIPLAYSWGVDGHLVICRLAQVFSSYLNQRLILPGFIFMKMLVLRTNSPSFQPRLSKAAAEAVSELLPSYADNDLGSLCSWADRVKFRYHWSSALHYIDTPDNLCTYRYNRDCKDEDGIQDRCVAGAINNYTNQLLSYGNGNSASQYNLTEALLFLSHFMGDIHQPLHVGFTSDRGGNTIDVHWYRRKTVLHHVWDDSIIETAEERFYDSNVDELINTLQKNITTVWANQAKAWGSCSKMACPDIYASEGIKAACDWAYKGVSKGSVLEDAYFLSRYPVVNMRLAQGGVRLAATLNRIFG